MHIDQQGPRSAAGWMEDDFHHFGVAIEADDEGRVRDARMASPRTPFTTCHTASLPLRQLIGQPLIARASDVGELVTLKMQCTHVIELAALVMAYIGRASQGPLDYEIVIPDREILPIEPGRPRRRRAGMAHLLVNGERSLDWSVDDDTVLGPAPFEGWPIYEGFRQRTEALAADLADQAMTLRRGLFVSRGRGVATEDLGRDPHGRKPVCHTFQPAQHHAHVKRLPTRKSFDDGRGMLALVGKPI